MGRYIAVDLGATSGRVAVVNTTGGKFSINVIHRFSHEAIIRNGSIFWNWQYIVDETIKGIQIAAEGGPVTSLAIDSWAADYGFLDSHDQLLPPIFSYRDSRTVDTFEKIKNDIGNEHIYSATGIQFLSLNTLYQLVAAKNDANYLEASKFLLLPDLLNNLLTGSLSTEITNASTTQLLNRHTRSWDFKLIESLGLRKEIFPALHEPGAILGKVSGIPGLEKITVVATGSHDTASAVAGTPFTDTATEAFLSSGTWSLLGIESTAPITTPAALAANITNELGVEGTVRILKNITGLWILEECRRTWRESGYEPTTPEIIRLARESTGFLSVIDPDDARFIAPGNMPERVKSYCSDSGQIVPETPGEIALCIFISLALAYRQTLALLEEVTGRSISKLHILGGGSQIGFLNQLTADATECEVLAGPTEATLIGNVAMQAIAAGEFLDLAQARAVIRANVKCEIFQPHDGFDWKELQGRIHLNSIV